ncbi:MAG: citrate lyase subunit alpha [Treponemataceae bacterium]
MKTIKNSLGIELPEYIDGYGKVVPYTGVWNKLPSADRVATKRSYSGQCPQKLVATLKEAIQKCNPANGISISFHHHLRNGDYIALMVVKELYALGIKDITINASSLSDSQEGLLEYIKNGTISKITTSALRGEWAKEISKTAPLKTPIVFRSHGGRARAIENGDIKIDIAFIGAPCCDTQGNMNGYEGKSAFGAMGYPMVDALYAEKVVAITDNLQPYPIKHITINQTCVDYVVSVDSIGDPSLIATKAVRYTTNPTELLIARKAAQVLIALDVIKNDFSFQAGAGGASLAVAQYLRTYMIENKIQGSFASGGIVSTLLDMLKEGLFKNLFDTQTFDGSITQELLNTPEYIEMSASMYANPYNKSCVAHMLDIMMLSATEIDVNFNVNSLTGSHGMLMGAIGGAQDTAAGAKITMMVIPAIRKRLPIVCKKVAHVVTPGDTVDILVTDMGISVNPLRKDILEKLIKANIKIIDINDLYEKIIKLTGVPEKFKTTEKIIGVIEYRDGSILDVIYQVQ